MLKLCDDIDTMAMTLLDGELADQELRDMELHLLGCPGCKATFERERAAHLLRRQRLAAPPAPALLRARVSRALDEVDRARRPSRRSYLLPGGATLAAVAALVVFVASNRGSDERPAGRQVAMPAVKAEKPTQDVTTGLFGDHGVTARDLQFQRNGTQFLDKHKQSAVLYYAVLAPDGRRAALQATVGDFEALGLDPALAREVGGYRVWLDPYGLVVVRDGARAIILSSRSFSQDELVAIVEQSLLVLRIGSDDPREARR